MTQSSDTESIEIAVRDEYITLGQLLKAAGVIGSGGEAKDYLADNPVLVNGELEARRGRKLRPGDVVMPPGEDTIRLTARAPKFEDAESGEEAEIRRSIDV